MKTVAIDFNRIGNMSDFYAIATKAFPLPAHSGNNLDALWDSLTGGIALPVAVTFTNLSMNQLEHFQDLIELFEEAQDELGDDFSFAYYLAKP